MRRANLHKPSWILLLVSSLLASCDEANTASPQPDAALPAPGTDGSTPPPLPDADIAIDAATSDASLDVGHPTMRDADLARDAGNDATSPADATAEPIVCSVQAPTSCPSPAPRFADVTPIFMRRCASCHASNWTGPWPLDTYGHIADWQDTIRSHLLDCSMPPPEAGIPMTNDERLTILTWIRCDLPM
jgi:hypothetical protein